MRVIAGTWRGRSIEAPKGSDTRPTIDRVRESLMSALFSQLGSFEDLRVLDAFAGSGALGIEALSRGAAYAVFCDQDVRACNTVRANLASLGAPKESYRVLQCDVFARRPRTTHPFDLVFLDPPYAYSAESVVRLLADLDAEGSLSTDVLIPYEHAQGADLAALAATDAIALEIVATKRYGDTCIEFLRKASTP